MSNLSNNRLNVTVAPMQISAVKSGLQMATGNLPFLIGLTTEERIALPAINVSNKAFTEDAINAGVNNATLLPSYVSVAISSLSIQPFPSEITWASGQTHRPSFDQHSHSRHLFRTKARRRT